MIIGNKYRNCLENALNKHNIRLICSDNNPFVDARLSGHADLSVVHIGNNTILASEYLRNSEIINILSDIGFDISFLPNPIKPEYPHDAAMNVCIIGKRVIYNQKTAYNEFTANRIVINCNQGYTKCSTLVVDENAIITSDRLIAANSAVHGIESLLIDDSFVKLQGFNKGFIGGAAFKISRNKIAFTGEIKSAEAKSAIESFLNKRGIEAVYLTDNEIFDIGSAIPIIEEI